MATKQANAYKEKGNAAFKAGNHQKAIEFYTYATEMDPKNPVFYTNRSTAYFKMKNYQKSLRDANKAIKCDPKWAKGYYRKGLALMELKDDHKEALSQLEKAAALKPNSQAFDLAVVTCKAKFMKGMLPCEILKLEANDLFKKGDIADAVTRYTKAINSVSRKPNDKEKLVLADIYANRAACNRQLYNSTAVIKDCTKALELNPNHVKAFIRRGQARESMEKFEEALKDFQQANYLAPGTSVAIQGASRIRASLKRRKAEKKTT